MARLSVYSDRVRKLVDDGLVPLFLANRSTAALSKALNAAITKAGKSGVIHPNRLHGLLSDDVSRGLHEATVDLVEGAVELLRQSDGAWQERSASYLKRLKGAAEQSGGGATSHEEIARRLSIPPAVARRVLADSTPSTDTGTPSHAAPALPTLVASAGRAFGRPDWSFQDTALSWTLDALRRQPAGKIGLILPTGAGKTRTALRIVLQYLAQLAQPGARVYWITHRKNLRTQAHKELQKLLSANDGKIPREAASLLAEQIEFVMVSQVAELLSDPTNHPALVVVDEAHHAAAPSYEPILAAAVPALFLTATPNRPDGLPIGIDEVAFTITYRELEERGVIFMPEFLEFPVSDFDWSPEQVEDLADYVIDNAGDRFAKVLVLAPRIDRVEEFCEALLNRLAEEQGHPLDPDDIGFIHGGRNSLGTDNDDFLAHFAVKPRAILVSAQLLLEGFDDPAINTVVIAYPSSSVIRLMQAAGRCVRYFPEKKAAYVVQARNDNLAYYFDQRWLYQEISDYLRPDLLDIAYTAQADLEPKLAEILATHNVPEPVRARVMDGLKGVAPGDTCRLLLYGYPYNGALDKFHELARWGGFLETPQTSAAFRGVFNAFSHLGADLSDPSDFLRKQGAHFGIPKDLTAGSLWQQYMELLTACYFAREELYGATGFARRARPSRRPGPTTWLRYVTFHFRPAVPAALSEFFADCHNRPAVEAAFLEAPAAYVSAIKIPLPLGGHEGWLLKAPEASELESTAKAVRSALQKVGPAEQFGELARYLASGACRALPMRVSLRIEAFLTEAGYASRVLTLQSPPSSEKGEGHDGPVQ
jgi:superfamily II DNA or RNA helicase